MCTTKNQFLLNAIMYTFDLRNLTYQGRKYLTVQRRSKSNQIYLQPYHIEYILFKINCSGIPIERYTHCRYSGS